MSVWSVVGRVAALVGLISLSILEYTDGDTMLEWSGAWQARLQRAGGAKLHRLGTLMSEGFTVVIFPFLYLHLFLASQQLVALYHISVFFLPVILGLLLKEGLYFGRPWVVIEDLSGSSCDPGLPSSHALIALAGYYVVYQAFRYYFRPSKPVSVLAGTVCTIVAAGISISRVTLGEHSVDQVAMSWLIFANFSLFFDFNRFLKLLYWSLPHLKKIMIILIVLNIAIGFALCELNHKYRERPTYWKYFWKNPECQNTFVIGQAQSVPMVAWPLSIYLFASFNRRDELPGFYELTLGLKVSRLIGSLLTTALLITFVSLPIQILKPEITSINQDLYLYNFDLSLVAVAIGFSQMRLSKLLMSMLDISAPSDVIVIEDIEEAIFGTQETLLKQTNSLSKESGQLGLGMQGDEKEGSLITRHFISNK